MGSFKKIALTCATSVIIILVVGLFLISPIVKYLIETYDEEYTGRRITVEQVHVNPITGYIRITGLKIFEVKSDSLFFSSDAVSADLNLYKLFSKDYEISDLVLDHPKGMILQNKNKLNFDDIIDRFYPKEKKGSQKTAVHFSILNIKINDGVFCYREESIPINYFVKQVHIESSGIKWNLDTITAKFSLLPGVGSGDLKGAFAINTHNLNYSLGLVTHKLDMSIIQQYLKDLTNYGRFSANLDADIKAVGNFTDKENIHAKGTLAINDFCFGKNLKDKYASFDKLALVIHELNPRNYSYFFDSVSLIHPYLRYELYDHLDNFQTIFGKNASNVVSANANPARFNLAIEIVKYIRDVSKNFFSSNYKINSLRVAGGNLEFNDYSINEKFSVNLDPLYITADSIDKNRKRVNISLRAGIKPYGNATVSLSINPNDEGDFDMKYAICKLSLAAFNPYTISFTSFPLDRGTAEASGAWHVRNSVMESENHLILIDPRMSKRMINKNIRRLPLPLLFFFIRERGNVIDYEIPISGNLKNPKFHFKDVILDLVKNILVKPTTTPYRVRVKNIEAEIETSIAVKWEVRNNLLQAREERYLKKMADFLVENPMASIVVHPKQYEAREKEFILFFEAKKKYFYFLNNKMSGSLNKTDSCKIEKMSIKDPLFTRYLDTRVKDPTLFTVQEKCRRLIKPAVLHAKFLQLKKDRASCFKAYFIKKEVQTRIRIAFEESIIPYNGYSFYKIEYKGEVPEYLVRANREMNALNQEVPRKKFSKVRKSVLRTQ